VIVNGINYVARGDDLIASGIDPFGDDDTVFGVGLLFCNQHLRVHSAGWCTVSVIEKFPLVADTIDEAQAEASECGLPA